MPLSVNEKYDRARPSYIRVNAKRFADLAAGTTILIPSPRDIGSQLSLLGQAEFISFTELRLRLAREHGAEGTCPVMTGMNLRILAERALDQLALGMAMTEVAPVWLVVAPTSPLASKLPGGAARITLLRELASVAPQRQQAGPIPITVDLVDHNAVRSKLVD